MGIFRSNAIQFVGQENFDTSDLLLIYDTSAGALKKISKSEAILKFS